MEMSRSKRIMGILFFTLVPIIFGIIIGTFFDENDNEDWNENI